MKVRIGFTPGGMLSPDLDRFAALVDRLEALRFDSLWLPEVLTGPIPDPLVSLAFAAGRTAMLKLGTHLILPGRNPVRLARQLGALDRLSGGRLLLLAVIGLPDAAELSAGGVPADDRTAMLDELLTVLRRLWSEERVTHHGHFYQLDNVAASPRPLQHPLDIWFGGMQPAALRRCGRLADGWMPGFIPVEQAAAAKTVIDEAAGAAGRSVDPEHFGANIVYSLRPLDAAARAALAARRRPGVADPAELVPVGGDALGAELQRWLAAGFSKFVLRPATAPGSWDEELHELAGAVLGLQTR
jgi:probable F420-dependent oxidoreductase